MRDDSCFWRCFPCVFCLLILLALCQPGIVGTSSTGIGSHYNCQYTTGLCGVVFFDDQQCGDNYCRCCGRSEPDHQPYYAECVLHKNNLTYIPQLPRSIRYLNFAVNNLIGVPLTEHFFSNVTHITDLALIYDNISHIEQNAFRGFRNLTCVDVSGNHNLKNESFRVLMAIPGLQYLSAHSCQLASPPKDLFSNMTSDVVELQLSSNIPTDYICLYDLTAYSALDKLRSIDIAFCSICTVKTSTVVRIQSLNLNDNSMTRLPESCAANEVSLFPNLSSLKISENGILSLKEACLPSLTFLDLSSNSMALTHFSITQYPGLQTLWMKNMITDRFRWASNLFSHPTLEELHLEGDNIAFGSEEIVPNTVFANCPRLTRLSLAKNNFENVDDARFLELLGHLSLEELNLSKNKLSSFSLSTLSNFSNLSRLELMGTDLSSIPDGAFDSLKNLSWLNLTQNEITTITKQTFSVETRERLNVLYLDRNPFTCSCELMWFRNWFVSDTELFHRNASSQLQYKCNNLPGTSLASFTMVDQACLMSHAMNVVIVYTCTLFIVTFTIASLVFRFRWNIRLALYEAFRGRGDVRRLRLLADHFDYDVFVSYDKEDLPWVYGKLMPELEGRLGLRLCVHERDFIPGNNIVDNIVECVQSSKKILMVFSKDFVRSQWCQFELTFCMNHVMNYDDVLLIVCVDDVASRDMTAAMMAVLKTTTYIQWEELDDAVRSFWGRLRLALHEIIPLDGAL
ncbi:toll-like receptor 13 [Littorina saxatilis]|uniref:TIR domain-containing protein n=1 Tax=Littorina saxatilis TaxID=31220 RepID=A0AAN9B8S1_9CAEN